MYDSSIEYLYMEKISIQYPNEIERSLECALTITFGLVKFENKFNR